MRSDPRQGFLQMEGYRLRKNRLLLFGVLGVIVGLGVGLARLTARRTQARPPAGYSVLGVDVSRHQGDVDWARVAASGVHFAYLKASEGTDRQDPQFARHAAAARRAGLSVGGYHFFAFCSDGAAQAANFEAALAVGEAALPPAIDVEFVGNCSSFESIAAVRARLRDFVRALRPNPRCPAVLYADPRSYELIVKGLAGHPLWIRSLGCEPRDAGLPEWLFWQFADDGSVPGIAGRVDLDVFRGGARELQRLGAECGG